MKKIVLTGGPCGGKTTAQRELAEQFARAGRRVICVPEVATLILGTGFSISDFLPGKKIFLQRAILSMQFALEDELEQAGKVLGEPVMICDRGAMDGKAYCTAAEWEEILCGAALDESKLLGRYDRIYHLASAADGAEEFYSAHTNPCRFESVEEALETERKLRGAWDGHPSRLILDNRGGMTAKVEALIRDTKKLFKPDENGE